MTLRRSEEGGAAGPSITRRNMPLSTPASSDCDASRVGCSPAAQRASASHRD